jgi:large subunit ribosomal protein L15
MANLNSLKRIGKRVYRRVGRGQSSTRGKQSGRGGKGQTARAGNKRRPEWRDIIKKLPKRRGYGKNRGRTVDPTLPNALALSLTRLDTLFESGAEINPNVLTERGLLGRKRIPVKIVGGTTAKKFIITGCAVSASARAVIEKAGGSIAALALVQSSRTPKTPKVAKAKPVKNTNKPKA